MIEDKNGSSNRTYTKGNIKFMEIIGKKLKTKL